MNKAFAGVFFALGGLCFAAVFVLGRQSDPRPNLVLIVIDTLRADRLHGTRNGVPIMPYLSAFAKESADYAHAVSPCSWTRPAMASIFTAREVDAHQVHYSSANDLGDVLASGWETMAEYLAEFGYDTMGYQSNGNLQAVFGFAQGFGPGRYTFQDAAPASDVTGHFLGRLGELDAPYFLYAHYRDPHIHYDPPEEHRNAFGPLPEIAPEDAPVFASRESFMAFYMERVHHYIGLVENPKIPMLQPSSQEHVKALYDGECHFADAEVGKLIDAIRAKDPNTIFVVVSDHGEEFWERGGMGHGTSLYEEQALIPLLIHGPGIAPRVFDETVSAVGILPTIATYLGLPQRAGWQGENLLAPSGGAVHTRTYSAFKSDSVDKAARYDGEGMKLIEDKTYSAVELYNLDADPEELENLVDGAPDLRDAHLDALHRALEDDAAHFETHGGHREQAPNDAETQRILEKSGYGERQSDIRQRSEGVDTPGGGE